MSKLENEIFSRIGLCVVYFIVFKILGYNFGFENVFYTAVALLISSITLSEVNKDN